MSDWQLEEVQTWAAKNHENTFLNGVYHNEAVQNSILSQDIDPGIKIKNNSALSVTYSLSADPEEAIELPDFKTMTLSEIKTWISDNQMSGVTIKYETSEVIPKDQVINYEFIEGSLEEFLRKNRMIIYVSTGTEDMDETFEMPDLYGKTRAEVMQWAKEQQTQVTILEIFNEYVGYGLVFEQSIMEDTKITRKDKITVSISRGKPILVPDFFGMSRSEAAELANIYGISVFFKLNISSNEVDTVICQDIAQGTEIDQRQIITVEIAKKEGIIMVPDFTGLTPTEANTLAGLYGIKVFLRNHDTVGDSSRVSSQSIAPGKKIDENQFVTLELVENKYEVAVPDFVGMSKNEAVVLAKNKNIELIFSEVETTETQNQTVIRQDRSANELIEPNDSILLTIAVNSGIKAEYMWSMSLKEAQAWASQNGIVLNVIDYYNSEYPAGLLYSQDCDPKEWIPANKVLTVYHSLGFVMADNFIGKTKAEIIKWRDEVNSKGASIVLSFLVDTNTTKGKGEITNQSILEELVELNKTISVWVSNSDNGVLIKNFEGTDLEDFKLWCDTNKVPYIVTDSYSDICEEGTLFGQNYTDTYLPKDEHLRIYHSLGKLYVKDFTNQTKSTIVEWQREANKKGAKLKIVFVEEYTFNVEKGRIIYQTVMDTEVDQNTSIVVAVSLGTY
jgi:beta-lactam-binding protein with PASTA domain